MIFISHKANPDHELAKQIKDYLESEGLECWLAPESIDGGAWFFEEIPRTLRTCEFVIVLITENSQDSLQIHKEIDYAQKYNRYIIPLKVGDIDIVESLWYQIAIYQIINFNKIEDLDPIVNILKAGLRFYEMSVGGGSFTLVGGSYSDNLDYFICNHSALLDTTLFTMGVDKTADLSKSTQKGILRHVMLRMADKYGVTENQFQQLLDKARLDQLGQKPGEEMEYGESFVVDVPIKSEDCGRRILKIQLIANSKNYGDRVEGPDSRVVIMKAFDAVDAYSKSQDKDYGMFIGAMGTNNLGMKSPYGVITTEILNCFLFVIKQLNESGPDSNRRAPKNVYYSVWDNDLKRLNLARVDLYNYISSMIKFYKVN